MSAATVLTLVTSLSMGLLLIAMVLCVLRILRGPTLPDRILGLDTLTTVIIGFIAAYAIRSGLVLYLDIAIALSLVGFLATVALTRYVLATKGSGRSEVSEERQP